MATQKFHIMSGNYSAKSVGRRRSIRKKITSSEAIAIPHAPIGRRVVTAADKDLGRWRKILDNEFPLLNPEQIARSEQPFHLLLLNDLISNGDAVAAQEINTIFRKEERERKGGRYRHLMSNIPLRDEHEKLEKIAETLNVCHMYNAQGQYDAAVFLRKQMGEKFMKEGDIWLSKHFLLSCLQACRKLEDTPLADKIQAEVHCLLAFLARENNDTLESALALAIDHLAMCRQLSEDQPWQFKPKVLTIKLKKPIAIHGLRFDDTDIFDVVDGCSMTIYMIATLLEHELLISLANQIMHTHAAPTDEDVKIAHEFADHALKLALQVRQPTAMSSALVRFGLVLRHVGAYEDALGYFEQLKQHCILTGDYTTEALAYHNIALCLIGCHNSVEAMECFAKQMDIASDFKMKDLEADAMYELGHILLQEGHLWEAEECYAVAYEDFKSLDNTGSHQDAAWAMLGVGAGQKLWGRFANLCRSNTPSDIYGILDWKCSRKTLDPINRPNYKPDLISKVYEPYLEKMKNHPVDDGKDRTDYEKLADGLQLSSSTSSKESKDKEKTDQATKGVEFSDGHDVLEYDKDHHEDNELTEAQITEEISIDDIQFQADYHPEPDSINAERSRKKRSIRQSQSMNESMKRLVSSRKSLDVSNMDITKTKD